MRSVTPSFYNFPGFFNFIRVHFGNETRDLLKRFIKFLNLSVRIRIRIRFLKACLNFGLVSSHL